MRPAEELILVGPITKYVECYCKKIVPEKWVLSGNWPGATVVEGPLDTFVDNEGVI